MLAEISVDWCGSVSRYSGYCLLFTVFVTENVGRWIVLLFGEDRSNTCFTTIEGESAADTKPERSKWSSVGNRRIQASI